MNTLPNPESCCDPCEAPVTVQVPGPAGTNGVDGADGADGTFPFTTVTTNFTMPGDLGNVLAAVGDTTWMAPGQVLWVTRADGSVKGYMQVVTIASAVSVTLKNLRSAASNAYLSNSASGTVISGSQIVPGGLQGPDGNLTGEARGDLTGTYPNPTLSKPSIKGTFLVGNGSSPQQQAVGTNGKMLAADSTAGNGVAWADGLPVTGGTDVADNRLLRCNGATGLPVPAQSSKLEATDLGSLRTTGGDPRGSEAVDLQATRTGSSQVASGAASAIGGGQQNTASGPSSVVGGGFSNIAAGSSGAICGGTSNQASAFNSGALSGNGNIARSEASCVAGGDVNVAGDGGGVNKRAFVGGGQANQATGKESVIAGGNGNLASGEQSTVCGGDSNDATGIESTVCGGASAVASGAGSFIGGGQDNETSADYSAIVGGWFGLADKYGQQAHAAGRFAADGDAQTSVLVMRKATTDATPTELFLNGSSLRCVVPTNTSWMFSMMAVARTSAGLTSVYKSEGEIDNVAGAVTAHGITTTEIYDGAGLPATPVVVAADDPNNALIVTVTGIAATNIRWVARIQLVEVNY